MSDNKLDRKNKRNLIVNKAIEKVQNSKNIRLILDGEEFLHDFDQMDARQIQQVVVKILEESLMD